MLTLRMRQLVDFLAAQSTTGIGPTFDEMAAALGLRSKSDIHRLLKALEQRGYIRRLPGKTRAIELIRRPEYRNPVVARIPLAKGLPVTASSNDASALVRVPHFGRLSPGLSPFDLEKPTERTLTVPRGTLPLGRCFAMDMRGDAMIEAGILEGDLVIIVEAGSADTGEIVLAEIDHVEVTLRRLCRKRAAIALEASNGAYATRIFAPDRVRILGRMCALIRKYPDYASAAEVAG
jgi:repressor LexA